jgi:DNA repair protein RadC
VALQSLSSSFILVHNHPSGNRQPSDADLKITKKIKKAAEYMEINVLDHIILTDDSYTSFADEGLI